MFPNDRTEITLSVRTYTLLISSLHHSLFLSLSLSLFRTLSLAHTTQTRTLTPSLSLSIVRTHTFSRLLFFVLFFSLSQSCSHSCSCFLSFSSSCALSLTPFLPLSPHSYVTWPTQTAATRLLPHSYEWVIIHRTRDTSPLYVSVCFYMSHKLSICGTNHLYDSLYRARDTSPLYLSLHIKSVTWYQCDMPHWYMWHDLFLNKRDMTHSYTVARLPRPLCRLSSPCPWITIVCPLAGEIDMSDLFKYDMTRSNVTWLIQM